MAGPCSVEGRQQVRKISRHVSEEGAKVLRGGAFKPRTSPHSFQGLGVPGLKYLRDAADEHGLAVITEVTSERLVEKVAEFADVLQVGARNSQNFELLKEVGRQDKPVLLKRGMAVTVDEILLALEYVTEGGNHSLILCERGIRTFEPSTRNTLDLNSVALLKRRTGVPVIVDPSHGTGRADLVIPMALAGIAAGADGLIVEVHNEPGNAVTDGHQSLDFGGFTDLVRRLRVVSEAINRQVAFTENTIEGSRSRIDWCDARIVSAVSERIRAVERVAELKREAALPVRDPFREREVEAGVVELSDELGVPRELTRSIFQSIVDYCVEMQDGEKK